MESDREHLQLQDHGLNGVVLVYQPFKVLMLAMKYILTLFFVIQTYQLRTLPPVLKPVSIYGMDSVNGKMNSGRHFLKVGTDLLSTVY